MEILITSDAGTVTIPESSSKFVASYEGNYEADIKLQSSKTRARWQDLLTITPDMASALNEINWLRYSTQGFKVYFRLKAQGTNSTLGKTKFTVFNA